MPRSYLQQIFPYIVIAIHKYYIFTLRLLNSCISCAAQPSVLLMYYTYNILILLLYVICKNTGIISRAIIYY